MANAEQMPELRCMESEKYRKYFKALCWSAVGKNDDKAQKKSRKKETLRRLRAPNELAACYAPGLLGNPSQFSVFSTVRRSVLIRSRHLQGSASELSDESDTEETSSQQLLPAMPKITSIGLQTVFALVTQARYKDADFCENALEALLDVLQGHAPEDLAQEPPDVIGKLHAMLVEIASGCGPGGQVAVPTGLTALASSCLIALSVARGEAELVLSAVASLLMAPTVLYAQEIQVPANLTSLQRSVQHVMLGTSAKNQWLSCGVQRQSQMSSFPVELPTLLTAGSAELVVRSLVSDGTFLYVYTSKGLLKIGTGYNSSLKQHVYLYKPEFFPGDRHGWLGYCNCKLYLRIGRKKTEVYEIDKDTLDVINILRLDPGLPALVESKTAIFSDGKKLGLMQLTGSDKLTIRMFDVAKPPERAEASNTTALTSESEVDVCITMSKIFILGQSPFEDDSSRRPLEMDAPMAVQLDESTFDQIRCICGGQEFAILVTNSGKVYYTGKGTSLGYKDPSSNTDQWTIMNEPLFGTNDGINVTRNKVVMVAIGHEGVHAVLLLDNGTALFTGTARRGEDGDLTKQRRGAKPTRVKKIFKATGHNVVHAACNYGSTALVTRQGLLLMFGKDTQHCDSAGVMTALRHEKVTKVALGKAHGVVLTSLGHVYTFGINNKGQCGRDFGPNKDRAGPSQDPPSSGKEPPRLCASSHTWTVDYCRVCVRCRECTGFSSACHCAQLPNRVPGEKCGCGEGDSGCSVCGICRKCADLLAPAADGAGAGAEDQAGASASSSAKNGKGKPAGSMFGPAARSEPERDPGLKMTSLPPARIVLPGGHRFQDVACGLHHTVLLTEHGEVLTFGSNQFGQLGTGDILAHHRIVRLRLPHAQAHAAFIAAGSNHTAVLTKTNELFTFGSYQKGALGRYRAVEATPAEGSFVWYATPGRVPQLVSRFACKVTCVGASGDQTFMHVSQKLIKEETFFTSTIIADDAAIIILPNLPEHTLKCVTVNKSNGTCHSWMGIDQVDFVNALACLDPLFGVLWCYQPQMKIMKCYNIQAFDIHKLHKCNNGTESTQGGDETKYPNYGNMKRLEDFKNLQNFEVTCHIEEVSEESTVKSDMSVLNEELAIPLEPGHCVTRIHAALNLLACMECLTDPDSKYDLVDCDGDTMSPPITIAKDDFQTVSRFESHGGGWGYSGLSVEAIRFMCDANILLGGFGLFGGRGDYTAKIKLYDIGTEGGDQEGDGQLVAESDEVVYECAPRDRFPVLFPTLVPLIAKRWYVAWACINGPSSDCGSSGQAMVISNEIGFHFKTSKKSNNGTDVNAGQIPVLLYSTTNLDDPVPRSTEDGEDPFILLSKNFCKKVTVPCFRSVISLMHKSWNTFKGIVLKTNSLVPIDYQKLSIMKYQKQLVYIIRACLRLIKAFVNEIYPQNSKKVNSNEYITFLDAIADARNLIQAMMADATPTCGMLPKKIRKNRPQRGCNVHFAMETTNAILKEADQAITACFHAFFPTPTLKWNHLCSLLYHVKDGMVPPSRTRELAATCVAMCASRSLGDVLNYVVPVTQSRTGSGDQRRPESRIIEIPSKSATVPRSSHEQKLPPPVPPRTNHRESPKPPEIVEIKTSYAEWHLFDALSRLLDIVLIPIKEQMMTRQCGQPHDHGEIKQNERLSEFCCKLIARIISELSYSALYNKHDVGAGSAQHLVTPSRFMRVNQARAWNTGNGSPDSICFTVDRPGIMLVGFCLYGGHGDFEYTVELLHDSQQMCSTEEARAGHYWVCEETTHGSFSAADCRNNIVQIKFGRPIPLREDLRYVIRVFNHGGRTVNGDCGLQSVKGPDGTTFRFASSSLSANGTTLARGQIPSLIYYGTSKLVSNWSECADSCIKALMGITLRVASVVIERATDLFCLLRNELTAEDLRRNAVVLQQSPAINILLPFTLANLEGFWDSKSVIKILEMVHQLLPHVAAMNLLVPAAEEMTASNATTTQYYTWVESEHPYKPATVTNMRVLFPKNVAWIVLEMDPRSITAQPEDTLAVYAVASSLKKHCHCSDNIFDLPFSQRVIQMKPNGIIEEDKDDEVIDFPCPFYSCTYLSVTPKMANNPTNWLQKSLLIPGNEAIFSFETASDYLTEFSRANNAENRYGFRCLCVGYEDTPLTAHRRSIAALEMELVYAGASCSARLLAPDLDLPPLNFSTIMEVQVQALLGGTSPTTEYETANDRVEAMLLIKGLELSSPPNIHHMLEGQPLPRCESTQRQFLSDFVAGVDSTAGGRLAHWLAPTPRVDPALCEIKAPAQPLKPSVLVNVPVFLRDQYGDLVSSPKIKLTVTVRKLEGSGPRPRQVAPVEGYHTDVPDAPYQVTLCDTTCLNAITLMKVYQKYSFEEIRLANILRGDVDVSASASGMSDNSYETAVELMLTAQPDGSFIAAWTPLGAGSFVLRCTLDDHPIPQELTVEVVETATVGTSEGGAQAADAEDILPRSPPTKLRRFAAQCSAGLRVRASPSLQAEELGRVPPGANISFIEEVVNKDGTWVRLSAESVRTYTDGSAEVAWCLQHHRHVDRALLVPVEPTTPPNDEIDDTWSDARGGEDEPGNLHSSHNDDELEVGLDEILCLAERRRLALQSEQADESASSRNAFQFSVEPSKRERMIRNESLAASAPSPSGVQRSNGNSDDVKDVNTIPETDIEPEPEHGASSSHAQTGTQTSPMVEDVISAIEMIMGVTKEGRLSPKSMARERIASRARAYKRAASPPPLLPARAAPAPPATLKYALSPAQVECMRAIFAAVVWHEGLVHDAIACATYLKFHPELSKQSVLQTKVTPTVRMPRHQRHSVEVVNAGQYLRIDPSTIDTLKRSSADPSTSRMRNTEIDMAITEEETPGHSSDAAPPTAAVNEMPSVLQIFVAIWDTLCDAEQLAVATNKYKKEMAVNNKGDDARLLGILRKKRDCRSLLYSVRCELCGSTVPPPFVATHMRRAHPGCRGCTNKGYDSSGMYRRTAVPIGQTDMPRLSGSCGQITQGLKQFWYMFCEKCREKELKGLAPVNQRKTQPIPEVANEEAEPTPYVDHLVMKENALFLLDLAPLLDSDMLSPLAWPNSTSRNSLTPPGNMWQPAPPFQCLPALGAAPRALATDAARYHSLGRPAPSTSAPPPSQSVSVCNTAEDRPKASGSRVQRSLSMGQEGDRDFAGVTPVDLTDTPADVGSSMYSQPSRAVQWLAGVGAGERDEEGSGPDAILSRLDTNALLTSPVLTFVLSDRNLNTLRQKMDAAVRINTVRQYAFEALNWLLRSTTVPTSVHDVMWWFCNALDKYARIVPPTQPVVCDDNIQDAPIETKRTAAPTASTSVICPGSSRSAKAARAAFHSFLGSVSAIAPSLPSSSAASLQAIRCWALNYSPQDRAFLHRSQVFNVISKILSHSEDGGLDEPLHESYHTYINKENFVWDCPDLTGWCDISVSSRQGMAAALTDGSTETFWESGDEDRTRDKWIQVDFPGGKLQCYPYIICVHIDNTRDTMSKTVVLTFLFSIGPNEVTHMCEMDLDPKSATWINYTIPRYKVGEPIRVRCELRGPETAVRVRQVRVLGTPVLLTPAKSKSKRALFSQSEADTLRVFRLLTSQVFGKLLDWDRTSEAGCEAAAAVAEDAAAGDTNLREHVVGILFAGHKLTSLQKLVMSHIVGAIGAEATRVRDDWEMAVLWMDDEPRVVDKPQRHVPHQQDSYCFEMLSLLLALSGSTVGCAHLSQRTELVGDLLALLHAGSERVQRQVVLLLKRMIAEIPPQKMLAALNHDVDQTTRVTLLDHLVCYLGKAITLQMKVKGAGSSAAAAGMTLGGSVSTTTPVAWFMRGQSLKKHAHLVAKLLSDMAEDKLSAAWGKETRAGLAAYVSQVAQVPEQDRLPARCVATPTVWMALAALCVCEQSHVELINGENRARGDEDSRPMCTNHDDGATGATIECRECGPLCAECDRFLHLHRASRMHHRQICKEEESSVRIDIHEGCGRAKLFWLLLLVDRRTLKALAEFRGIETGACGGDGAGPSAPAASGEPGLAGTCRFCGSSGTSGLLAIGNVCADQQCQEHGKMACNSVLACGHLCGGVQGEVQCLPCLYGCAAASGGGDTASAPVPLLQDADDMCVICFTDPLQAAPALQLQCGHVFHLHCCKKVLLKKWIGPRITFSFAKCPICKMDMDHWALKEELTPIRDLQEDVRRKALMRLEYEGVALAGTTSKASQDPAVYAMEKYAYYVCHLCGKAYFGGLARCEAEMSGWWEPSELVCGACSDVACAGNCPKHVADFLEYKCRFCCSVAVFFCFGTTHFCNACHDDFQRVTHIPKHLLPRCPAGPKGEQLPGTEAECPLRVKHPPTGEEFALGCGVCRNSHAF